MKSALAAVETLVGVEPAVLGLHHEGPVLSPGKSRCARSTHAIRRPTADDLAMLTAKRQGVTLVTLAPECVPEGFIAELTARKWACELRSVIRWRQYAQNLRCHGRGP